MKIELFRGDISHQWFFRIRARNGRIVAQSEGYKRKASAEKTALAILGDTHFARLVFVK